MPKWCVAAICLSLSLLSQLGHSCTCVPKSAKENFTRAETIFRIRITSTQLRPARELAGVDPNAATDGAGPKEYVGARFELLETFKGMPDLNQELRSLGESPGSCILPLSPGIHYVVFLRPEDLGFISFCSGSFAAYDASGLERMDEMRALRSLSGRAHPSGTILAPFR